MGYYSAIINSKDSPDENRALYEIVTRHRVNSNPSVSAAYTKATEEHKILRWVSNSAIIPKDIMSRVMWPHKAVMDEARDKQLAALVEQYIEAQANRTPEQLAEEASSLRGAFGPGHTIVNLFTGKRTQT